jgi:hypothetical protein
MFFFLVIPIISPFTFSEEELNLDDSVTATCSIMKGDLPIKIWWTLSDSYESTSEYNITTNDGIVISKTGNKLSVLNIEAVKARHRGNYTCYASNRAGIAHHSAYLAING